MGAVKFKDTVIPVEDGEPIRDACEQLGVPFGCRSGLCGTCMITIEEGENNLTELTPEEESMDRDRKHRLACQTQIRQNSITITFDEV
ncbi:ferredoxin [Candidatus Woesearchaeota archaeon CG10_big_fil_rev_8_21_14_0_10_45_16]|nr:MAG: ferredoxin [Candidatus Woesearchaeota archaeon CG10_big_fil_rev_8_21_14_0_10_45_16]